MDNYQEIPDGIELPDRCLSTSELPHLFWASYYGDPLAEKTQRKLSKSVYAPLPFSERANDPSWQRKYDRKIDKALLTLENLGPEDDIYHHLKTPINDIYKWIMDEAFECDPSAVVADSLEQMRRTVIGESLVTGLWLRFEQLAIKSRKQQTNESITILFDYILSCKRTWINDDIEIILLMLIAFLELESICSGNRIGYIYEESMFSEIPLHTWIPESQSGDLKTTRYCVLDYCLKNLFENKNRTAERFRGEPKWNKFSDLKEFSPLRIKAVIPYFGYGQLTELESLIREKKVQFAYFIGWYQIHLFKDGVAAEEIVKSFSKIESVRESFYEGLLRFSKQRNPI